MSAPPTSPSFRARRDHRLARRTSSGAIPRVLLFLMLRRRCCGSASSISASLFALLLQSFFSIDEFSGLINREFTLDLWQLLQAANFDIILRTVTWPRVTLGLGYRRLSHRLLRGALCAREMEGAILSGRHAAAVVELSRQGLCLEAHPREGGHPHLGVRTLHLGMWLVDAWLALPVVGGNSLSISYTGTFLVFLYVWLPFMILPIQAALERVPAI
jgi:putative spermidine/putrescine transport system permease protein